MPIAFDRLAPSRPINAGGPGAIEVNARYDYLDLNDAGIVGGRQRTLGVSLVWAPISYVRLTANYGRLMFDDARSPEFELALWNADLPASTGSPTEALRLGRRWLSHVEALMKR